MCICITLYLSWLFNQLIACFCLTKMKQMLTIVLEQKLFWLKIVDMMMPKQKKYVNREF